MGLKLYYFSRAVLSFKTFQNSSHKGASHTDKT